LAVGQTLFVGGQNAHRDPRPRFIRIRSHNLVVSPNQLNGASSVFWTASSPQESSLASGSRAHSQAWLVYHPICHKDTLGASCILDIRLGVDLANHFGGEKHAVAEIVEFLHRLDMGPPKAGPVVLRMGLASANLKVRRGVQVNVDLAAGKSNSAAVRVKNARMLDAAVDSVVTIDSIMTDKYRTIGSEYAPTVVNELSKRPLFVVSSGDPANGAPALPFPEPPTEQRRRSQRSRRHATT
jgi:hypothetical protein